jgi:ABC-type phosphate transport system substrate-binding protein
VSQSSGLGHWFTSNLGTTIAGAALLVTIVTWLIDHRRKRRRITYRVHMNTPIGPSSDMRSLGEFVVLSNRSRQPVPEASLVLVRIANNGRMDVGADQFDLGGPEFTFEGRVVEGFEPFEMKPRELAKILTSPPVKVDGNKLTLPAFNLNLGERFKLLILLSGTGTEVDGGAHVVGGSFDRDDSGNGPSRRTIGFGAVSVALAGALIAFLLSGPSAVGVNPVQCVAGAITIAGSTAFQPAVSEIARDYNQACPGSNVTVTGDGSVAGINALNDQSVAAAMYDGSVAPGAYPALTGSPTAVVEFAVVVNKQTGVHNLTTDQLRGIYSLRYTNWLQLGGSNHPITIVARDSQSGTRITFVSTVLGGRTEPNADSQNCTTPAPGQNSPVLVCEMAGTQELLQKVSTIPGAIGYAEFGQSTLSRDVNTIQIDSREPDIQQDQLSQYPFWAAEHVYTHGPPASGSLLSVFLGYLGTDTAKNVMEKDGDVPCGNLTSGGQQNYCGA